MRKPKPTPRTPAPPAWNDPYAPERALLLLRLTAAHGFLLEAPWHDVTRELVYLVGEAVGAEDLRSIVSDVLTELELGDDGDDSCGQSPTH